MSVFNSHYEATRKTKIHLSEKLLGLWRSSRQLESNKNEAFGVLVGSQSADANEFWLEICTMPQKTDSATRTSFSLRALHHQDIVDSYYKSSNGKLGYVGTWHTHPEPTPVPSKIDIEDWHECIKRNPDRGLVFVIVGKIHLCIFRPSEGSFERIYKERIND